jgi:ParB family chromosome partitioning protein
MPSGLGRGLDSLIPKKITASYSDFSLDKNATPVSSESRIWSLDPAFIHPNPWQPRREFSDESLRDLAESISLHGIMQPLVVTKVKDDDYELIAGERRWRASKLAGLKAVPVIIRDANSQKKLELALIENLQRESLNPIETAVAYNQLLNEFNLTQEETAKRVGKPRSSVANSLRFLKLPAEIQTALAGGRLSEGHAKYLMGIESEAKQSLVFKKIIFNNLSVRQTDDLIRQGGGTKEARVRIEAGDAFRLDRLHRFFGKKALIRRRQDGGRLALDFASDEELDSWIDKLVK